MATCCVPPLLLLQLRLLQLLLSFVVKGNEYLFIVLRLSSKALCFPFLACFRCACLYVKSHPNIHIASAAAA